MGAELRVTFLGEHQDARKAVAALDKLLRVVTTADATRRKSGKPAAWRFSRLALGSVAAGIAPPSGDSDAATLFDQIVAGFGEAEEREGIPAGWTSALARTARDLIDGAENHEVQLEALRDDQPVRSVRATIVARRHLDAGLTRGHRDSIGSVIGHLDSISVHDKNEARLWPERGGPPVLVRFSSDDLDCVKSYLGERVEASGRLRRDQAGQLVSVQLRTLERLPSIDDSPPLTELIGLDPDFTGGVSSAEYLREIRGEAR